MNIYDLIDNYYNSLEVVEIFPDEDDWEVIKDYWSAHTVD